MPAKLETVWEKFRDWKFDEMAPNFYATTEWIDGAAGRVDSTIKITYKNGATWCLRVTELSERSHKLSYEVVQTEPATSVSSMVGEFSFERITDDDETFLCWSTEYSNDIDAEFLMDGRWKKRDLF